MDKLPPIDSAEPWTRSTNTSEDSMMEAKKGARRLLGCYRTGDAHDPETYIAAVVSVLAQYSPEVIRTVTNPVTGIPSKIKWLPAIAEIREACDEHGPSWSRLWAQEWDEGAQRLLAERERLAIPDYRPKGPSVRQYTYEEFMAMTNGRGRPIGRFEQGTKFENDAKPVLSPEQVNAKYPKPEPAPEVEDYRI